MDEVITVQFDGGSRGNPGPAGIGVVLSAADGTPLVTLGRYIGRATNNAAEYAALIAGLQEAKKLGAKRVAVRGDSELIVRQMRGEYKVRNADLRPLYEQAQSLLRQFDEATIQHNYRHNNALADKLANLAMDRKAEVRDANEGRGAPRGGEGSSGDAPADASTSPLDQPSPVAPKAGDRFACARCGCVVRLEKPSSIRPHQLKPFACQCGAKMADAPRN
jgi:ribonuclease HI